MEKKGNMNLAYTEKWKKSLKNIELGNMEVLKISPKWFCMEPDQPSIISTESIWLTQLAELAVTPARPPRCPSTQLPSVSWGFVHLKPVQVWCFPNLTTALRKAAQSLVSCRTSWVLLYHLSHVLLTSSLLAMPELGHSHAKPQRLISTKSLHYSLEERSEDNPSCHNKVKSCQAYVFSLECELHMHSIPPKPGLPLETKQPHPHSPAFGLICH